MKIIECPRDAMQGLKTFIPTETKVSYLSQLLKIGFETIDFGSFVSPKAVPQMKDTAEVLNNIEWRTSSSSLLAIVANLRGAEEACEHDAIRYLGFPLSISETFQQRNTNKSIGDALEMLNEIQNLCMVKNKKLVTYISMAFGNPYGDRYDASLVSQFVDILATLGCEIISLADTIGVSSPENIRTLYETVSANFSHIEFGVHLHATPEGAVEKIAAAYGAGCRRFDGAILGYGGCPMAKDELVGNLATETIVSFLREKNVVMSLNEREFSKAMVMANEIFTKY